MASLVPGYEHDVFVSYATVDDRPAKCGWVSAFVSTLGESLSAAFGVRDPHRIWWDRTDIDEESLLTAQIRNKVRKSVCMVVILSQGYAKSNWCSQEREAFLAAVAGQPDSDRRLFLIDIGNLEMKDRPPQFTDKRGRHFFVQPPNTTAMADRIRLGFPTPDPENKDHKEFFAQVDQLANALRERVSSLPGTQVIAPAPKSFPGITLFVAEAADDVAEEREEVGRFLSDHFQVVPSLDEPLPNRWDQWQASVDAGLESAKLFVQVLGVLPGRKIAGSDQKLVIAQTDRARTAGKRVVAWRKSAPDVVPDQRMKDLVTAAEFCGPLEEFKAEIKRLASPSPPEKFIDRPFANGLLAPPVVFIHAGVEDKNQAELLSDQISRMECFTFTPLIDGTPEMIREDLEANLTECDGLILFYGRISPSWLRSQLRALPRALSKRQQLIPPRPLKALAICNGEPPGKPRPGIPANGLEWIDLSLDLHREQLARWVSTLRNGGAP